MTINCPSCDARIPSDARFCDQCGTPLSRPQQGVAPAGTPPVSCPQCGRVAAPGQAYCEQCGATLGTAPASAPVATQTPPGRSCPQCNRPLSDGDTFCTYCGYAIVPGPAPSEPEAQARTVQARLVMEDNATIPLPSQPEVVIGREDPVLDHFPDVDLTPFGASEKGVSRKHARIVLEQDRYFIEDLESVNYTFLNQEKLQAGQRQPLQAGDQVRFGRVIATFQTD